MIHQLGQSGFGDPEGDLVREADVDIRFAVALLEVEP
jgi:hypothetical protein